MATRSDVFDSFEPTITDYPKTNPWRHEGDAPPSYEPAYDLLADLLSIPVGEERGSESGRLAKAIDAWVANELRRSGFPADEVWPRLTRPRVLPRELGMFIDALPKSLQHEARRRLLSNTKVAPSDARVLGRAYVKQVDVLIAQWARGPELLVSTKSMVSSFRNNLANRFEESYGDAKNLRGRYPLAAMGFLLVVRSTILKEPGTFEKAVDMLRKLQSEPDAYDATCIVLAEWDDETLDGVTIRTDEVPPDLAGDRFLSRLIEAVLNRTPVDMHVVVRERREHRDLPFEEPDAGETLPTKTTD
ncbi:hypothetical protein [Flindersiella endophytica]